MMELRMESRHTQVGDRTKRWTKELLKSKIWHISVHVDDKLWAFVLSNFMIKTAIFLKCVRPWYYMEFRRLTKGIPTSAVYCTFRRRQSGSYTIRGDSRKTQTLFCELPNYSALQMLFFILGRWPDVVSGVMFHLILKLDIPYIFFQKTVTKFRYRKTSYR